MPPQYCKATFRDISRSILFHESSGRSRVQLPNVIHESRGDPRLHRRRFLDKTELKGVPCAWLGFAATGNPFAGEPDRCECPSITVRGSHQEG